MFGKKGITSDKFKGLGCLNCPSNRYKDIRLRESLLLTESCNPDILFIVTSDNEKLFELIDKHFENHNIAIAYLTKCSINNLRPTSPEISCCKQQVLEELQKVNPKIIVGFDHHFLTWIYGKYYDSRTWRGRLCPIKFNDKETYQYTSLSPAIIEELKFFEQKEAWTQIEVDFKNIKRHLKNYKRPVVWEAGYETGIKIISGMEDGDFKKLEKELNYLAKLDYVALDIENSPLKPWMNNQYYPDVTAMASIAIGTFDYIVSFPLEHPKCWNGDHDRVLDLLEEFLVTSGTKICHNLKHELHWFYWYYGKEVLFETDWIDTQALSYILHNVTSKEKNQGMHNLGKLTLAYYGFNLKDQREVDFKKIFDEPIKDLLTYNGRDSKWECKLYEDMLPLLDENQKRLFDFHNKDCITWAIAEAEGYKCDVKELDQFKKKYTKEVKKLEDEIFELPELKGKKFDLTSPQQLANVFINDLKVELPRNDKNNYVVDAKALQDLAIKEGNKLATLILPYRKVTKQLSTYVNGMYDVLHPDNHFHSDFNSTFTKTGRKSCNNPNGQNFPKRGEGKEIRKIVVPEKDCVIISVDFGQLEARGYCMISNERTYIEKIKKGIDIHMEWAKRILELYPEACEINNEKDLKVYRGDVKNVMVFPSFYGAGINSRAFNLGLPIELMEQIDHEFWVEFPKIKKWQEDEVEFFRKHGYVETLTGRKLRGKVDEKKQHIIILSMNDICNYPVQGTCSDIVCDAANRLSKLSYELNEPALQPQLNIHDDLTFTQVPRSIAEDCCQLIMKEMCRKTYDFIIDVPLQVELAMGNNWAEMEDLYVKDTRDFCYD